MSYSGHNVQHPARNLNLFCTDGPCRSAEAGPIEKSAEKYAWPRPNRNSNGQSLYFRVARMTAAEARGIETEIVWSSEIASGVQCPLQVPSSLMEAPPKVISEEPAAISPLEAFKKMTCAVVLINGRSNLIWTSRLFAATPCALLMRVTATEPSFDVAYATRFVADEMATGSWRP